MAEGVTETDGAEVIDDGTTEDPAVVDEAAGALVDEAAGGTLDEGSEAMGILYRFTLPEPPQAVVPAPVHGVLQSSWFSAS